MNKRILTGYCKRFSQREIAQRLDVSQTTVRYWLAKYNLCTFRCKDSPKVTCLFCGKEIPRGVHRRRKYCDSKCHDAMRFNEKTKLLGQGILSPKTLRKILINEIGNKCEICGSTEWLGEPIPVVLDHINGNSDNDSRENIRLVCPNCDAQLPTFKARNKGNGRSARKSYRKNRYYKTKLNSMPS